QIAPIPYWENLFPSAAGQLGFGPPGSKSNLGCAPGDNKNATNYTATQAMYDMFSCFPSNETTAMQVFDLFCLPACAQLPGQPVGGQPFNFFDDQWSSLYSWRSIGSIRCLSDADTASVLAWAKSLMPFLEDGAGPVSFIGQAVCLSRSNPVGSGRPTGRFRARPFRSATLVEPECRKIKAVIRTCSKIRLRP